MKDKFKIIKPIFSIFFILFIFQELLKCIFSYIFYSNYNLEILKSNFFKLSTYSNLLVLVIILFIYLKKYGIRCYKMESKNILKSLYLYFFSYFFIVLIINIYINLSNFIPFIHKSYNEFINGIGGKIDNIQESKIYIFLYICILAPLLEELIFRGILYNEIKKYYSEKYTIFITSILFAMAHFNLIQSTYTFILGICLGYIIYKYKDIKITIFIHFLNNVQGFIKIGYIEFEKIFFVISIIALLIFLSSKIYKIKKKE